MKRFLAFTVLLLLSIPGVSFAHATPLSYEPGSSSRLEHAPETLRITFSERPDETASSIRVKGPDGAIVSGESRVSPVDAHVLEVPLKSAGEGAYRVSWGVVSRDDGHFTKGAYAFVVGQGVIPGTGSFEIVEVSTVPEALSMSIELFGNGILWGALLLFALVFRPLFRSGAYESVRRKMNRLFTGVVGVGVCSVVLGGGLQVMLKTADLARLHDADALSALPDYLATTAGEATIARIFVAVLFGVVFFVYRKQIYESARISMYEYGLATLLLIFAYARAVVSHATANPFFPELSVAINTLHLVEKDLWAGALFILVLLASFPSLRILFSGAFPRVSTILSWNLAGISLTASYIVWLHLKSLENLFTTRWGGAFLSLAAVAAFLVVLRAYHSLGARLYPTTLSRFLGVTLILECVLALSVLYASSMIIITSPPLHEKTITLSARNEGVHISVRGYKDEDNLVLLSFSGLRPLGAPSVSIIEGGERASVELSKRFEGGYVFPTLVLPTEKSFSLEISVPQEGAYDARATFPLTPSDVSPREGSRPFDAFALVFLVLGVSGFLLGLALARASSCGARIPAPRLLPLLGAMLSLLVLCALAGYLMRAPHILGIANPYRALCERDGNAWHSMPPTWAGTQMSEVSREGCMALMGAYHIAERGVYDSLRTSGEAVVSFETPERVQAGTPVDLSVSILEKDGSPARLFLEHERYLHVVIVSADMSEFAHIHSQDGPFLTPEEERTSTFRLTHTFPKAGEYIIATDYAHGLRHESRTFSLTVLGALEQAGEPVVYEKNGRFNGYDVSLEYALPLAGEVSTLQFFITRGGEPVENLEPYLGAAMHVAVVKHDLSEFLHTHGEVHPPGQPIPPVVVKDGNILHSMSSMYLPEQFPAPVDAHVIFPTPGLYTVFGEFSAGGEVVRAAFTVRVER